MMNNYSSNKFESIKMMNSVWAVLILDSQGKRILSKYYDYMSASAGASASKQTAEVLQHSNQKLLESQLFEKCIKQQQQQQSSARQQLRSSSSSSSASSSYMGLSSSYSANGDMVMLDFYPQQTPAMMTASKSSSSGGNKIPVLATFKQNLDVWIFVLGDQAENELILSSVLNGFYEALSMIVLLQHQSSLSGLASSTSSPQSPSSNGSGAGSSGAVDKRSLLDALDMVMLALDEMVSDGGIVLELDPAIVYQRVAASSAGGMLGAGGVGGSASGAAMSQMVGQVISGDRNLGDALKMARQQIGRNLLR